jgi:hypothetical protein
MARAAEQGVCSTNPWGEMAHRLCHRASGTLPARAGQVDQAQTQTLLSLQRARLERTLWRQPDRLRRRLANPHRPLAQALKARNLSSFRRVWVDVPN